jgi:hypothetical protein
MLDFVGTKIHASLLLYPISFNLSCPCCSLHLCCPYPRIPSIRASLSVLLYLRPFILFPSRMLSPCPICNKERVQAGSFFTKSHIPRIVASVMCHSLLPRCQDHLFLQERPLRFNKCFKCKLKMPQRDGRPRKLSITRTNQPNLTNCKCKPSRSMMLVVGMEPSA